MKFKLKDKVLITAGKDKGKTGIISRLFPQANKIIVAGINQYKKHLKPQQTGKGQIVTRERPLPTANIALVCPHCQKPTRIGFLVDKTGQKHRLCHKCHAPLIKPSKKA